MSVWAVADLQLLSPDDLSGPVGTRAQLAAAWQEQVADSDLVLLPGGLSSATSCTQLLAELTWLEALPGRKLVGPGTPDRLIWSTQQRARRLLAPLPSLTALCHDALALPEQQLTVAALRGARQPGDRDWNDPADLTLFARELRRLERTLERAAQARRPDDRLVLLLHRPPFVDGYQPGVFTDLIEAAGVDLCLYGQPARGFAGVQGGVHYQPVSCATVGPRLQPLFAAQTPTPAPAGSIL